MFNLVERKDNQSAPFEEPFEAEKRNVPAGTETEKGPNEIPEEDREQLQPLATSMSTCLLYVNRVARFNLVRAACAPASKITKRARLRDRKLLRLIQCVNSTRSLA